MNHKSVKQHFRDFILNYARKHHPAALVFSDPKTYFNLSKYHRGRLNTLARKVGACVTKRDRRRALEQFTTYFENAVISELRPTDRWIGKVTVGAFDEFKNSQAPKKARRRQKLFPKGT